MAKRWSVPASWLLAQAIINICGPDVIAIERRGTQFSRHSTEHSISCAIGGLGICGCALTSSACGYGIPSAAMGCCAWKVATDPHYRAVMTERSGRNFIRRLQSNGYSVDPGWSGAMIAIIDRFNLDEFDL
jgi:hypothetical protein